jgi:UDP-glucose 4-epimerase
MAKNRRILVTGVARWWGALTVQRLVESRQVAEVIGIDTVEPHHDLGRADFLRLDIRHSLIGKLVRAVGIDTVVHTATTIDSFDPDPRRAHETNVIGTLNLLAGLEGPDSPVRRVVLKSSTHVYGSRFDLPAYVREDRRLDANSRHAFVRDLVELESYLSDFQVRNQHADVLVLRFANSLNAEEPQPLARYLDLPLVPTVMGYDPILQLIHRDDCIEALVRAALDGPAGPYNIAAPAPRPLTALLAQTSKLHAPLLPPTGLSTAAQLLRTMGIAFLTPQLLDLLRWGRTVSTARAERELRFMPRLETAAALEAFYEMRRVIGFLPDRGAYLYEKELEDFIQNRRQELLSAAQPNGESGDGKSATARPARARRRRSPAPHR